MNVQTLSPSLIEWDKIATSKIAGERGFCITRKLENGDIRMRLVDYSQNYMADHWCLKGHFVYVVEGSIEIEHSDQSVYKLEKNMGYVVGDEIMPHRVISEGGARVFIVD